MVSWAKAREGETATTTVRNTTLAIVVTGEIAPLSHFGRHSGELVVVIIHRVASIDRSGSECHVEADPQRSRQPDRRKWLSHLHGGVDAVDSDQPPPWQEVRVDVLEIVLEDLVFSGIDP